ncbi:MAG: cytochrome c biogenesis protein ResB [Paenibacillaceae bacterium]
MKEIDMRYEGAARWSHNKSKSIVNLIWNFFSSVRVGIYIILSILILSIFGTIFPQEHFIDATDPKVFYTEEYGIAGGIFYTLGFTRMYNSWWFKADLGMLLISLVIASLDRVIPLYRALKNQTVRKHSSFLKRQRIHTQWLVATNEILPQLQKLKHAMQKKGYTVREDGQALLAEKARFSRWGPYINHIGLITIIIGTLLMTSIPGWYLDKFVWVQEGEIKQVTGTPYYVKNEKFTIDLYSEAELKKIKLENKFAVKRYQTDVVLYEKVGERPDGQPELKQVLNHSVSVNDPLRYKRIRLYQADYTLNEWKEMTFTVSNKKTGEKQGDFTVDLVHPEPSYELPNGMTVVIEDYLPALSFNENREPINVSSKPENPAFFFLIKGKEAPKGELSWAIIGTPLDEIYRENVYKANFKDLKTVNTSGIKISMNKGMSIIWTGAAIFMIGIAMGLYWQHRRIWLLFEDGIVFMGAHTNKGWVGIRKDIALITKEADLHITDDQIQIGGK